MRDALLATERHWLTFPSQFGRAAIIGYRVGSIGAWMIV